MRSADPSELAREIARRRAGAPLLLCLDFDGTLCEFHPDPAAVWPAPSMRSAVEALVAKADVAVALVSGRRLQDVRDRAGLAGDVYYAGLHGLEIEGPGERFEHPGLAAGRQLVASLAGVLAEELRPFAGVFIENKEFSIVAHYRDAGAAAQAAVPDVVERLARPHAEAGELRVMRGACALELLPNVDWNKGSAVAWIDERVRRRHPDVFTLYIGDDVTDEDGFRAVAGLGLGIAASERPAGADFRIDGPPDVEALLDALR